MMDLLKKIFAFTALILALIAATNSAPAPEVLESIEDILSSTSRVNAGDRIHPRTVPSDDRIIPSGRFSPSSDRVIPFEDRVGPSNRVNPAGRTNPSDRVHPRIVPSDDRVIPFSRIMPFGDRVIPSDDRVNPSGRVGPSTDRINTSEDRTIPSEDLVIPSGNRLSSVVRDVPSSDRNIDPSYSRVNLAFDRNNPPSDRVTPSEDRVIPSSDRTTPSENRINPSGRTNPSSDSESTSNQVQPRNKKLNDHLIHLETGICFQDCIFNPNADNMCTFSFVEHSNWQSHAVLHIYDNMCNQIGENTAVTRDSLASPQGFGMSSELPLYLVLHVPRLWNQDNPAQVKWDYGNYRNMPAFTDNPFGNAYASTYRIPSVFKTGDREGSYTVGRAGFICK
ncbi:hypothetical protein IFR04_007394 [Cadophora malorum]|uniref:Uncharacterized protein n=1 Tax=Cadophora malorum TaxID=108018 RepID=A0A8H7TGZ7_9HELO|nr:hypothetical protein IFR04_007394 [Cadophora malorum]